MQITKMSFVSDAWLERHAHAIREANLADGKEILLRIIEVATIDGSDSLMENDLTVCKEHWSE